MCTRWWQLTTCMWRQFQSCYWQCLQIHFKQNECSVTRPRIRRCRHRCRHNCAAAAWTAAARMPESRRNSACGPSFAASGAKRWNIALTVSSRVGCGRLWMCAMMTCAQFAGQQTVEKKRPLRSHMSVSGARAPCKRQSRVISVVFASRRVLNGPTTCTIVAHTVLAKQHGTLAYTHSE